MLIVDDEPNNRKLLVSLLTPFGFELQEASNGQEAIDLWKTWEPHLIWMDMRMPVLDGYEATKYIKSEIRNSKSEIQTVVIAVTASSFEEERAVVLSAGCDDFLRKLFREVEIFGLLYKHLGVRFVYEEPEQGRKVAGVQEYLPKGVLIPEAIAMLPDELRTGLRQAVEVIDMERANSLIEQIRQQDEPLAEVLAELVKNYRFDILQELFEKISS
jgi:CheY-like chemotaxis protein